MYHCHLHICLVGRRPELWAAVKGAALPERHTCTFSEYLAAADAALAGTDLILADLDGLEPGAAVQGLLARKDAKTSLVLLAEPAQAESLFAAGCEADDVWLPPFTPDALRFHFLRWLRTLKASHEAWQTYQFLEATINQTPNLVWYKDKDGIHEKVNDSFCQTVNKTKQQVEGRGHAYIWDVEQDDPACVESERIVMGTRKTLVSEETIQTGSGLRTLTTYKSPLYDLDGSVMGTVGIGLDVTREREYEQELLRKNKTLETIFTSLDCGVLCHTLDGQILSVNRAALQILGYSSQEELAEHFNMVADSVLDEDKDILRGAIQHLQKVTDNVSVDYRVIHPDGRLLHVTGSIRLLEENGIRFYQRFLLDCTEQRLQVDRERKETEQYHRELIDALSQDYNLVCLFNLDTGSGSPLRINECEFGILNPIFQGKLMLEESMGHYIDKCVYQNDREMTRRVLSRAYLSEVLAESEFFYYNYRTLCGGRIRYFQLKAVRAGAWGKSRSVVLGLRCVDEETRREMEKKELLENALDQANRANRAKSTFLSNMSHDIRTPMNAIIGFTTLAVNHLENTEQVRGYLNKIMASGSHLLNLINDVLDMSHIESGKIQLDEKPAALPDILKNLRSIVQIDARNKGLQLCFDASGLQNDRIVCDRLRLNQVLLNLLSNAIKYTETGGILLTLTELPGPDSDTGLYEFRVRDTGIGMSEDFIRHIFEPFERERNSTISGIQGTGLGMAITKNLVDMMHGEIKVESRQGEGTLVTVRFPFRLCASQQELPAGQKSTQQPSPAADKVPHSGRILLVEDNELNQEIAVALLEEEGFTVEVASNGREAVEAVIRTEPGWFRLVLMDIQMPVMNGYQAAEAIRALPDAARASIPIIAMTANAFEEDKQEALRHGMNAHIAKPINVELLLQVFDRVTGQ